MGIMDQIKSDDIFERIIAILNFLYQKNDEIQYIPIYSITDIENMNSEEIYKILGNIDMYEVVQTIQEKLIKKATKTANKRGFIPDLLMKDVKEETDKYTLSVANKDIIEKNKKLKQEKSALRSSIGRLQDSLKELQCEYVNIDKVVRYISETDLKEDQKDELISMVKEYAVPKNEEYKRVSKIREEKRKLEELKIQEMKKAKQEQKVEYKLFDIKNYDYIKDIIDNYEGIFSNNLFQMSIEENFGLEDLTQILSLRYSEIDEDLFSLAFTTILFKVDNATTKEDVSVYAGVLKELCEKYELLNRVQDASLELQEIYSSYKIDEEDNKMLLWAQSTINMIHSNEKYTDVEVQNILSNVHETLHKIKRKQLMKKIEAKDNLEIKSFILFDYYINDDKQKRPYVLSDLNENSTRTMIDNSIDQSKKQINGYNDFNDLIDDMIIYGKPKLTIETTDKIEKFVRPVYKTKNAHDVVVSSMKNATGMYRIRPRITSYVRFIDERFILVPNTERYNQVMDILESKLKNVSIDRNKPFNLYINNVDAFKLDDKESYLSAINRQKQSVLRDILKKDKFSSTDLKEISEVIDMTINAFKELEKMNPDFEFKSINKLTDKKITLQ